jgi:hypothetical protein
MYLFGYVPVKVHTEDKISSETRHGSGSSTCRSGFRRDAALDDRPEGRPAEPVDSYRFAVEWIVELVEAAILDEDTAPASEFIREVVVAVTSQAAAEEPVRVQ